MNKLGILGWPLTTTYSPLIHNKLFELSGLEGSYQIIKQEEINSQIILEINNDLLGYNITIPHKEKIIYLQKSAILSSSVKDIGACNTVLNRNSKIYLFNTDFSGFKTFLDLIQYDFGKKSVLILGSGGSAKAIAYTLKLQNINYFIASRHSNENTISYNEIVKIGSDIDLVINTTPVGMPPFNHGELPIKWNNLPNIKTVINLGYGSKNTFLNQFEDSIAKYDGLGMLVCQAIESFNIWTSAGLNTSRIYGEVIKELENIDD